MLRSFAELAAYGSLALLLILASLSPTETSSAGGPATVPDPVARGRMLFAVKGCVGCHTHAAVRGPGIAAGPDLTLLVDHAASRVIGLDARSYVRQSIRDPGAFVVSGFTGVTMPDLAIADPDIDALVTFLLTPR